MNRETVKFHLENIRNNKSKDGHIQDLKLEISSLRIMAFKYKGSGLAKVAEKRANDIEKELTLAILDAKRK